MKEIIKWEMPVEESKIEIKLNDETVLREDAKQFIDYLSDSIVTKNSKAMLKRNIYMQTIDVIYKLGLVYIVVKFFPEILGLFIDIKGLGK